MTHADEAAEDAAAEEYTAEEYTAADYEADAAREQDAAAEHEHAEAAQDALSLVRLLLFTYAATTAERREQAETLANLFNNAARSTIGETANAYHHAAELITEAADSYTDTDEEAADAPALDLALFTAAQELDNAAHEARERAADYS